MVDDLNMTRIWSLGLVLSLDLVYWPWCLYYIQNNKKGTRNTTQQGHCRVPHGTWFESRRLTMG